MQFRSKAKFVRFSPYKLRPYVDVVRGKSVHAALHWLATCSVKRAVPILKVIKSAAANAQHAQQIGPDQLVVKTITVDEGPMYRYYRAGAMGRAKIYRRRFSHVQVVVESIQGNKE